MNKADYIQDAKRYLEKMKDNIEEAEKTLNRTGFDEVDAGSVVTNAATIYQLCEGVIADMANIEALYDAVE